MFHSTPKLVHISSRFDDDDPFRSKSVFVINWWHVCQKACSQLEMNVSYVLFVVRTVSKCCANVFFVFVGRIVIKILYVYCTCSNVVVCCFT